MKRVLFIIAFLIFPTLVLAQEAVVPAIDPEAVSGLIQLIITITSQFPWGIYVMAFFSVLPFLLGGLSWIAGKTPPDWDNKLLSKIGKYVPTMTSFDKLSKISGIGALDIDAARALADSNQGQYETHKAKTKKTGFFSKRKGRNSILIIPLLLSLTYLSSCAAIQTGPDGPTRAERLEAARNYMVLAQTTLNSIEDQLPALYSILDTYCDTGNPPDWCIEDLENIKADMADALVAASGALGVLIEATDAGKIKSAEEAVQKVVQAMVQVTAVYARITIIIARHN